MELQPQDRRDQVPRLSRTLERPEATADKRTDVPRYYPIFLEIERLACLVVGAGSVGLRKVEALLECGGKVTVVAPTAHERIEQLAREGRISLHRRAYETSDLAGVRLVFAATGDEAVNRRIASEARERGVLVNVVDRPELCDFIVPSVVRRGQLALAVSTGGACPALARRLRVELERRFDPAYAGYVDVVGRLRNEIISRVSEQRRAARLIERLVDAELLDLVRREGSEAALRRGREMIEEWIGGAS